MKQEQSDSLLGGNGTDISKPMTNNNWIEQFDKEFPDMLEWYGFEISEEKSKTNIRNFISNLLTKKDQEHKAELEIIKGEIENSIKNQPTDFSYGEGTYEGLVHAKHILDSHINKLSTE